MGGIVLERLPLAPLERCAFLEAGLPRHSDEHCVCHDVVNPMEPDARRKGSIGYCFSQVTFAHHVGQKSEKAVRRWIDDGGLTHAAADKAATALGFHPSMIWEEW